MKKYLTLFLALICTQTMCLAFTPPMYDDVLPASVAERAKATASLDKSQLFQNFLPETNAVEIWLEKKYYITAIHYENFENRKAFAMSEPIYDKLDFVTTKDVYKNGQLYIKKGETVTGLLTDRHVFLPKQKAALVPTIKVSYFKTKDVNGKEVKLYGTVSNEDGANFYQRYAVDRGAMPAILGKHKPYTVYFKE